MKTMSRRPTVVWIACILSMSFIQCEESAPTKESKDLTLPAVKKLVGDYRLDHFQVAYDDGSILSDGSPNVVFTGSMTVTADNQITQDVTFNGVSVHMTAGIVSAPNDSTLQVNSQKKTYNIRIRFAAPVLTTVLDAHQIGGNFIETDTWSRTPGTAQKRMDPGLRVKETAGHPGGGAGAFFRR
jgi:hypothetical protein